MNASKLYDELIIWTLEDNRSRGFYKKLGGKEAFRRVITIAGQELNEVGYLYENLKALETNTK